LLEDASKIVAFGAHPGDPIWGCGATLAKYAKKGYDISLVSLSYGEHSHAHVFWRKYWAENELPSLEEIKRVKREELEKASKILGINDIRILDYGDSPLSVNRERMVALVNLIRELKPDVVFCQFHFDPTNYDHGTAGKIVAQSCHYSRDLGLVTKNPPHRVKYVYLYSMAGSFGPEVGFIPDLYIDVNDTIFLKVRALAQFKTQEINGETYSEQNLKEIVLPEARYLGII